MIRIRNERSVLFRLQFKTKSTGDQELLKQFWEKMDELEKLVTKLQKQDESGNLSQPNS